MFNTPRKIGCIKNDGGYTMIEALVAIAIFSIGFMAAGAMQINSLNKTNSSRRVTEAMTVVENQVAQLRAMPFYNALDQNGDGKVDQYQVPSDLDATKNPHIDDVEGPYTVRWTILDDVPLSTYPLDVKKNFDGTALSRSKTIRVWATPDNNTAQVLAKIEFAEFEKGVTFSAK